MAARSLPRPLPARGRRRLGDAGRLGGATATAGGGAGWGVGTKSKRDCEFVLRTPRPAPANASPPSRVGFLHPPGPTTERS